MLGLKIFPSKYKIRKLKKNKKERYSQVLGYQIPVTQLYGDMQAAKRD